MAEERLIEPTALQKLLLHSEPSLHGGTSKISIIRQLGQKNTRPPLLIRGTYYFRLLRGSLLDFGTEVEQSLSPDNGPSKSVEMIAII